MNVCREDEGVWVCNIADAGGRRYVAVKGERGETNENGVGVKD